MILHFLVNDLSLAAQFRDINAFRESVERLMQIRKEILRLGSSLFCSRAMVRAQVTPSANMQQAVQGLPLPQRQALMQWLTKHGPHWEDAKLHGGNDWMEVDGQIITDTALGEVAFCRKFGIGKELVSFDPSNWLFSPIRAVWLREGGASESILIPNHWECGTVLRSLANNPEPVHTWEALSAQMRRTCTALSFVEQAFEPLEGHPFVPAAAERIRVLLNTLDRIKSCSEPSGERTPEARDLYVSHFTGDKAWFSDSSDSEKREFESEMSFPHPENRSQRLFCTWHGKVKTPQIRIHFSMPIRLDVPLYVVYVGPKITKR